MRAHDFEEAVGGQRKGIVLGEYGARVIGSMQRGEHKR